jgi:phosphoglycolate phosphatase
MIKGFLFDKDGTLIDFNEIWLPVTKSVAAKMKGRYQSEKTEEELLKCIGVNKEKIDADGILASKTTKDIAAMWYTQMDVEVSLEVFAEEVKVAFLLKTYENIELVKLLPGVKETLYDLRSKGFYLGIATADTQDITELMLKKLGIKELFEFIGTYDGITPEKPHPAHLQNFCAQRGLISSEVAMIGDTLCDMKFGKNFGAYTIGVLSGAGKQKQLQEYADLIIPSAADLMMREEWKK